MQSLTFDNSFVRQLPADPATDNRRRQVHGACYSRVLPTAVAAPRMLAYSREMAQILGLDDGVMASQETAEVLAGNRLVEGMDPYAACYGGHQFGHWAGQLGDGRAITLGETLNAGGQRWELQLKGAGPTPYSRTADGRAVVRSSVREFLCSEAMHHLGVPTTRALSLVGTGEKIVRDMFYDGNPRAEPGAVVCRVAPSFLRLGNFEIFTSRGDHDTLLRLADYALRTHFPELGEPSPEVYVEWLAEVCRRTARMVCHWQRVGFVHGVMNTDNLSILGLTIDYGPYGWLDVYDPDWTPNTTDAEGRRYRYAYQPQIAHWNLVRFAEAIHPLVGETAPLEEALGNFESTFTSAYRQMMLDKLGLASWQDDDQDLILDLQKALTAVETDMTLFFRSLADLPVAGVDAAEVDGDSLIVPLAEAYYDVDGHSVDDRRTIIQWLRRYLRRAQQDVPANDSTDDARRQAMQRVNPKYVPRNYLAQLAIDKAEEGDGSLVDELLEVMRHPYDEQPQYQAYAAKRPEWARHRAGCSMLSCSS